MVDWYGRWTYVPNTPERKKCDMDKIADYIMEHYVKNGYQIKTSIENLAENVYFYAMLYKEYVVEMSEETGTDEREWSPDLEDDIAGFVIWYIECADDVNSNVEQLDYIA